MPKVYLNNITFLSFLCSFILQKLILVHPKTGKSTFHQWLWCPLKYSCSTFCFSCHGYMFTLYFHSSQVSAKGTVDVPLVSSNSIEVLFKPGDHTETWKADVQWRGKHVVLDYFLKTNKQMCHFFYSALLFSCFTWLCDTILTCYDLILNDLKTHSNDVNISLIIEDINKEN